MLLIDPDLAVPSLRLRRWEAGDAPALAAAWADPSIAARAAVPAQATPEAAAAWIDGWDGRADAGLALDLVIGPPEGGSAVWGEVGLAPIDWARGVAEIGYWLTPPMRGRGVATAAVDLLAAWALDALPISPVVARIDPGATASAAVVARAGFARRGLLASGHDLWARTGPSET